MGFARFVCPVCELPLLAAPPEMGPVCPACGTEFEIDDRHWSHAELRRSWLERGAPWFSSLQPAPPNWRDIQLVALASFDYATTTAAPVETLGDWNFIPVGQLC
jgi:hypothetical protein